MQEGQRNQRTRLMREKIAELSKIDPNAHLTKEELEEKKKKFWAIERKGHLPSRSENQIAADSLLQQRDAPKPTNVIGKIFAFDSNYYKNLHHKYQREQASNIFAEKAELLHAPAEAKKKNSEEPVKESKIEAPKIVSNANQGGNFIKLLPVSNQETNPEASEKQEKKTQLSQLPKQNVQEGQRDIQPTNSIPLVFGQNKANIDSQVAKQPSEQEQPKEPLPKSSTDSPKISFFDNPEPAIAALACANKTGLFSLNTNKQPTDQKAFSLFSQSHAVSTEEKQQSKPLFNFGQSSNQAKDNPPKPALFSMKPIFNFTTKLEGQKCETQQITSSEKPLEQRSFSQSFGEKKQGGIKAIFEASNGSLNLNPAKPVDAPQSTNLFGAKIKENSQSIDTRPNPVLSLFGNAPQKVENNQILNPSPFFKSEQVEIKPKTTLNEQKNTSKPIFSGIFSAPSNPENAAVPFFGQVTPPAFNTNATTTPAPTTSLFASNNQKIDIKPTFSQPVTLSAKPEVSQPSIGTHQTQGTFQKKTLFGTSQATPVTSNPPASLFENAPSKSLFQNAPSSGLFQNPSTTNIFQNPPTTSLFHNPPATSTIKVDQLPPQNTKSEALTVSPTKAQQRQPFNDVAVKRQSDKEEKKEKPNVMLTAIGPGGKKIEMPSFSPKPNFFSQTSQTTNLFKQPANTSTNLFQAPANNIFQANPDKPNLFSQTQPTTSPGNLFTQASNNLFGNASTSLFGSNQQSKPLFGISAENSIFSKQNKGNEEEEGAEQEEDDGPIEAEDDANPNLSTGKYDYVQTQIIFKENANKFREGVKQTMDNIVISIEKFEGSDDRYLYVRMPNKCIAFTGKFVKKVTDSRIMNNNAKNIQVQKILKCGDEAMLSNLRLQFKDEATGERFTREVGVAIGKNA